MAVQDYTTTTRRAPFLEAAQEKYIDLLTQGVGRAPGSAGVPTLAELGPTVAPVEVQVLQVSNLSLIKLQHTQDHKLSNNLCRLINNR